MATVSAVTVDSPHLDAVRALWRKNSQALGFYPNGAFEERARSSQVLGAFESDELVEYLLFYTTKSSCVRITHLCVSDASRRSGVARALISELQATTIAFRGIGLYCRRDFPAWSIWPRFGFQAVKEKVGKSKDGHELTYFWFEHSHRTLFSQHEALDDEIVTLVVDANVFYDLLDPQRREADESLGLVADWLQPVIRLQVTPELFNEIQRNPDSKERTDRMTSARRYDCISANHDNFETALARVESIFGRGVSERDKADQRQLAWAIAAGCDVFVTRDQRLLDHSNAIYTEHGLIVERPADVISRFEEIRNEHEYQRDRLIGTDVTLARQSSEALAIAEAFCNSGLGERKGDLARMLNKAFACPDSHSCKVVYGQDEAPICMYMREISASSVFSVRLFRLRRECHGTRLGNTVIRTVLATIVKEAAELGCVLVRVADPLLCSAIEQALRGRRFLKGDGGWSKLALNEVIAADAISKRLNDLNDELGGEGRLLVRGIETLACGLEDAKAERVLELESLLWPAKISGTNVASFVVPIRPNWASDLFDGRLATGRLWAAATDLVLNPDSVYYRSSRPKVLCGAGRILWYVSSGTSHGSKMLRACSQLTGMETGSAKALFRKYRRFGVFDWKHVVETAKSADGELMALEFTNTELFRNPLDWSSLKEILNAHGKGNYTFPSPVKISDALFFDLYNAGGIT